MAGHLDTAIPLTFARRAPVHRRRRVRQISEQCKGGCFGASAFGPAPSRPLCARPCRGPGARSAGAPVTPMAAAPPAASAKRGEGPSWGAIRTRRVLKARPAGVAYMGNPVCPT
ncbi:hypothetical protein tb265_50240 [Gemmatimonadetes bacterium T265]|nr:hypothetical protein tb265_50240 [Gemmatimonadetes bacterium T265]